MHVRKFDFDYSRRIFTEKTARGILTAGVLTPLWPLIADAADVGKAYPEELLSIDAYTKGKIKTGDTQEQGKGQARQGWQRCHAGRQAVDWRQSVPGRQGCTRSLFQSDDVLGTPRQFAVRREGLGDRTGWRADLPVRLRLGGGKHRCPRWVGRSLSKRAGGQVALSVGVFHSSDRRERDGLP